MEKMGVKRRRKVKGVRRSTTKVAAALSEGCQKLLTWYKRVAEANPSNYILISFGGGCRADNNGGNGWSSNGANGADGGIISIADHGENMKRFMIHGKLMAGGADLAAKKMGSNRGRGRGSGPGHTPKKVGLAKSRLLRRL